MEHHPRLKRVRTTQRTAPVEARIDALIERTVPLLRHLLTEALAESEDRGQRRIVLAETPADVDAARGVDDVTRRRARAILARAKLRKPAR